MIAHDDLTIDRLRDLLDERFAGVLTTGQHCEDGQACVRELRAVALGLAWSDHPDGNTASPTDCVCQRLNDAAWSSDAARTEGCLPLALLSEATAPKGWVDRYVLLTIQRVVPAALRAATKRASAAACAALEKAACACEVAKGRTDGRAACLEARKIAADAASAAYAAASDASDAAADAAYAAAYAAADAYAAAARRDDILRLGVAVLLEAHGQGGQE